jgi:hypothetical protein
MAEQMHIRASFRKLVCVVGALLVMAAPMFATVCAPSDCASRNSKVAPPCSGMEMPKLAVWASASKSCCQMTEIPPATLGQTGETQKVKAAVSIFVVPGNVSADILPTFRSTSSQIDSSPPHDVQSLLCTLLI